MQHPARFQPHPPLSQVARWALLGFGGFNFALGAIGLVLPILPTTVFWIVAIGCFSRASPRIAARLVAHPRFGRPFADWLACGAIDRRGKIFAIGGMGVSVLTATLLLEPAGWLLGILGGAWIGASVYLATRPAYCPIV
ncbi:MAG: YbaN family protein [Candidatus Competibacteraceae bacterium]|nr:YbaN family protein [Candidatus Competibacteraceae bacterium]